MNAPKKSANKAPSRLSSARSRLAALIMGALSATGCSKQFCLSYSFDLNKEKGQTEAAKEYTRLELFENGSHIVSIPEADAEIHFKRIELEGCRSKIEALMNISPYSALRKSSCELREFEVPEGQGAWGNLIVQPLKVEDGGMSIRTKNNAIALAFKCESFSDKKDLYFCEGDEIEPQELGERISGAIAKAKDPATCGAVNEGNKDLAKQAKEKDESKDGSSNEPTKHEKTGVFVDLVKFRNLVNQLRAEKSLAGLDYGQCALAMSEYWANHPAAPAGGHEGGGETPKSRLEQFNCASEAMENVSWPSNFTPDHIFRQWKESPGHLQNMLKPNLTEMGLHCRKDTGVKNGNFCVMIGVKPKQGSTPLSNNPNQQNPLANLTPTDMSKAPDRIFSSEGKIAMSMSCDTKAVIDQLGSKLRTAHPDFLGQEARRLAKGTKWETEVNQLTTGLHKEGTVRSLADKLNLALVIEFLLSYKPEAIGPLAKTLGVTIDPQKTAELTTSCNNQAKGS